MFTLDGVVPSGFTLEGVFLTFEDFAGVVFAGVVFIGVVFAVVEDTAPVALFIGVAPAVLFTGPAVDVLLTVLAGWITESLVAGFFLTGNGFVVPRGVRWRAGFEASLTAALFGVTGVFFAGVVVDVGLAAGVEVADFFPGVEVGADVAFAGVAVAFAAVEVDAPAPLSFFGTLFAGGAAELVVFVAVAAGFLTGVDLVVDAAVLVGVLLAGFFAVDSATLEIFPTLAIVECQNLLPMKCSADLHWSAAFCCLSWSMADILC